MRAAASTTPVVHARYGYASQPAACASAARCNPPRPAAGRSASAAVGQPEPQLGLEHTDRYAWGQVAGFDGQPDSFLEVASAAYRIGPLWTPFLTPIVLSQSLRAHAALRELQWHFDSATADVRLTGRISAPRADFVALRYRNPPGGEKLCLNSKLASCQLTLTHKRSGEVERLTAEQRAAFEILSDPPAPTAAERVS